MVDVGFLVIFVPTMVVVEFCYQKYLKAPYLEWVFKTRDRIMGTSQNANPEGVQTNTKGAEGAEGEDTGDVREVEMEERTPEGGKVDGKDDLAEVRKENLEDEPPNSEARSSEDIRKTDLGEREISVMEWILSERS
ncbi:hypothetical protein H072_4734 [Dactylellina haptotyla CBS 200.50]|uniref:Uncharacterized protein n=1 Tax=Dactylellina haptotyla (strain CBS 200.50) TaxID=1284197 RepID=S8AEN6_DACHA|nr:hypothetical protein H072_4734 [Dactylellina haptotyla CBS 200.50]